MHTGPRLTLDRLEIGYERSLVPPISVEIESPVVVVRGPNGSGKTTLLRTLGSLVTPRAGTFRWAPTTAGTRSFVADDPQVHPLLTVREAWHLLDALRPATVGPAAFPGALAALAPTLGMHLSLGQRRRVAVAMGTAWPGILLLDEPMNGLDGTWSDWLGERLSSFVAAGGLVAVSTNDDRVEDVLARHDVDTARLDVDGRTVTYALA